MILLVLSVHSVNLIHSRVHWLRSTFVILLYLRKVQSSRLLEMHSLLFHLNGTIYLHRFLFAMQRFHYSVYEHLVVDLYSDSVVPQKAEDTHQTKYNFYSKYLLVRSADLLLTIGNLLGYLKVQFQFPELQKLQEQEHLQDLVHYSESMVQRKQYHSIHQILPQTSNYLVFSQKALLFHTQEQEVYSLLIIWLNVYLFITLYLELSTFLVLLQLQEQETLLDLVLSSLTELVPKRLPENFQSLQHISNLVVHPKKYSPPIHQKKVLKSDYLEIQLLKSLHLQSNHLELFLSVVLPRHIMFQVLLVLVHSGSSLVHPNLSLSIQKRNKCSSPLLEKEKRLIPRTMLVLKKQSEFAEVRYLTLRPLIGNHLGLLLVLSQLVVKQKQTSVYYTMVLVHSKHSPDLQNLLLSIQKRDRCSSRLLERELQRLHLLLNLVLVLYSELVVYQNPSLHRQNYKLI